MPGATPATRIRAAVSDDAPTILAFIRELAAYERLSDEVRATEDDLRRTLFRDPSHAACRIAEVDGRPAGFALFFPNYSTFLGRPGLYLEDLYVRPEFRGRGIGEALLADLARIAIERGCGRLEWSVLDWNGPALRFYRRLGAVAMDGWTVHRLTGDALDRLARGDAPQEPETAS